MLLAGPLAAQTRRSLTGETELRRGIGGALLGKLTDAATVTNGKARGGWAEVTISGWIIRGSVDATTRDGFDLIVGKRDGENLRAEPNGTIVARLEPGALLRKMGRRGGWWHVKRTGWVRKRALAAEPMETAAILPREAQAPEPRPSAVRPGPRSQAPRAATPASPPSPQSPNAAPPAAASAGDSDASRMEVARSAPFAVTPDGGRAGTLEPGTGARVMGRAGDWVRVEVEGWMREADLKPSAQGALLGVSAAEVRADPQRFTGQTVQWRVQLIAVQTADELRPELPAGQPFLLTRGPLPEPGFVYVIIPRDEAARFQNLPPLQELVLRVTIRAPRTKYLATPVVELLGVVSGLAIK